jgi:hypothetical protein
MQVSEGSDTFEFRSPHSMKAAHSRLRTFAGMAVRHLQHFNHPGRAWHDLSGPHDTLTVVLAEIGGRCEARTGRTKADRLNLRARAPSTTRRKCLATLLIFLPTIGSSQRANQDPAQSDAAAITVYKDFAVVRSTIDLDLKAGATDFTTTKVTRQLEPDSVVLRGQNGGKAVNVLEQNHELRARPFGV